MSYASGSDIVETRGMPEVRHGPREETIRTSTEEAEGKEDKLHLPDAPQCPVRQAGKLPGMWNEIENNENI